MHKQNKQESQLVERLIHGQLVNVKVFPPSIEAELARDADDDYADAEELPEQERLTWC